MSNDPFEWAGSLEGILTQVWVKLVRGVNDRHSAARHPTLTTVSPDGKPQARTVVLRTADRKAASLTIYADRSSGKVRDIGKTPSVALHIWDPSAHLQIRLDAKATVSDDLVADQIWGRLNEVSRSSYGRKPGTGQLISDSLNYQITGDRSALSVLRLDLLQIDALQLGSNHRRARFCAETGWTGQWLVP